jgi:hypothetical protein
MRENQAQGTFETYMSKLPPIEQSKFNRRSQSVLMQQAKPKEMRI